MALALASKQANAHCDYVLSLRPNTKTSRGRSSDIRSCGGSTQALLELRSKGTPKFTYMKDTKPKGHSQVGCIYPGRLHGRAQATLGCAR
jgi:hypothetical protein